MLWHGHSAPHRIQWGQPNTEEDRREVLAYLRTTVQPLHYMLARTLHNVIVLCGLACLVLGCMGLLLGWAELNGARLAGFASGMILTAIALGFTLTLLALIAVRAGAGFGMTAILGLPLVLPIVLVSTRLGGELMSGVLLADAWHHFAFLGALSVGSGVFGRALPVPLARVMTNPSDQTSRGVCSHSHCRNRPSLCMPSP